MVHSQQFSKLELMQGRVKFIPDNWKLMHIEKAYNIRNNLRLPINGTDRDSNPGPYPYYGPTKIQGYIGSYEQDGDFVLIGEDGDHFLKYKWQVMTQLVEGKCTVNNHAHILEETDVAIRKWFYYYFMHRDIFSFLTRQGAGRFKLNKAALAKLPVLIPPLPEQKKIAKILSTWDKAITTTEQLIANSQQQKKALMQQLLTGKKRLAGFSGEWEELTLDSLGKTFGGLTGKSKEDFGTGKPYIPYMNIFKSGKIDVNGFDLVNITEDEKQNPVKYGDMFFTTSSETPNEVGMSSVLLDEVNDVYLNSFCFGFRLHNFELLDPDFAQFLFRGAVVRRKISALAQGATRYNLSKIQMLKIILELPPIKEQQKIAQVLSSADQEIETLQQKLNFLEEEKKALMQQLLTGKRRVKLDD